MISELEDHSLCIDMRDAAWYTPDTYTLLTPYLHTAYTLSPTLPPSQNHTYTLHPTGLPRGMR